MDYFVHGLFREDDAAARAVRCLVDAHFEPSTISALLRDRGAHLQEAVPTSKTGVARGAAVGAALGAVAGPLMAVGGFLAGGPLLAAVAGGATGALAGALGGLGRWKDEIDLPEHEAHAGMILVGVSTDESGIERAQAALAEARPERIHVSAKGEACREVETGALSRGEG